MVRQRSCSRYAVTACEVGGFCTTCTPLRGGPRRSGSHFGPAVRDPRPHCYTVVTYLPCAALRPRRRNAHSEGRAEVSSGSVCAHGHGATLIWPNAPLVRQRMTTVFNHDRQTPRPSANAIPVVLADHHQPFPQRLKPPL